MRVLPDRRSLKAKLIGSKLLLATSLIVVVVLYFPAQQKRQALKIFEGELRVLCETLAISIGAGLENESYESMAAAFEIARRDTLINHIVLLDPEHRVMASYPAELSDSSYSHFTGVTKSKNDRTYCTEIRVEDEIFGHLVVSKSLNIVQMHNNASQRNVLILGAIMLLAAVILSYMLASSITKPICALTHAAETIARGQLQARAPISTDDEIGMLAKQFNVMADAMQKRDAALRGSRDYVESIIQSMLESLVVVDLEQTIEGVNQSTVDLLGYEKNELVGKPLSLILQEEAAGPAMGDLRGRRETTYLSKDGTEVPVLLSCSEMGGAGGTQRILFVAHDITERKRAEAVQLQSVALEAAANAIAMTDHEGTIIWVNEAFTQLTGYTRSEAMNQNTPMLKSGVQDDPFYDNLWKTITAGQVWRGELVSQRKDGSHYTEEMTVTPVRDEQGAITHFIAIKSDISERKRLESDLRSAQKLESIGQLAAGIAHEINTPIQYVGDNTRFLQDAFADLEALVGSCEGLLSAAKSNAVTEEIVAGTGAAFEQADMEYLAEEIPKAIDASLDGVKRVSKIVMAMKAFSHPGQEGKAPININNAIETTATVSRNEWKYVAKMEMDLGRDLPAVPCMAGEINQVILNIIVNAAHAIEATGADGSSDMGVITVNTRQDGDFMEIRIGDTGTGIPQAARERVFDPFFTTKEVGKGSGQGLAIAYSVVVDKHDGTLEFETEEGQGTTFIIRLPLEAQNTEPVLSPAS